MRKIVYTRPSGKVSIVNPSPRFLAKFNTEAEGMVFIAQKDVPSDTTDVVEVDEVDIPTDFTFRDAWVFSGGAFSVDMPAARAIHAVRINGEKREVARDLIEREMMGENIAAERAALQAIDVTAQIAAAQSVSTLKAVWPTGLQNRA